MSTLSWIAMAQATPKRYRLSLALAVALVFAVSVVTLTASRNEDFVSVWWPAAGVSVAAALIARGNPAGIALAIWAAAFAARLTVGQDALPALAYAFANAVEVWIIAKLLRRTGEPNTLDDVSSVGRFVVAVLVGALSFGALAALVTGVQGADPLAVFLKTAPSHASAILLLVPCLMVARVRVPARLRRELLLQSGILASVMVVVFLPGQSAQFKSVTLPVLIWAALRFGASVSSWQMLVTGVLSSIILGLQQGTVVGAIGSTAPPSVTQEYVVLQVFLIMYSASLLVIAAGRTERLRLTDAMMMRDRLLRGGIVGSQIGLLLLRETAQGSVSIVDGNAIAAELLGVTLGPSNEPASPLVPDNALVAVLDSMRDQAAQEDWSGQVAIDHAGRRLQVFIARVRSAGADSLITVQVIDTTARHAAEKAVAAALENEKSATAALREINRQKEDFVSSVSHELRTPIMSLMGFAEELADTGLSPLAADYLSVITRNAHRLADLVEDLLEVSRVSDQNNRAVRPLEVTAVNEVIRECVEELGVGARAGGVTLDYQPTDDMNVAGNRRDVGRVLTNILANAVKFTPSGGTVSVSCRRLEDVVLVEVVDNGVGIPPDEIDRVLERFYRSSASVSLPGTGLGLAIVTGLLEQLGGSLKLSSDGVTGTQACITLLAAPATADLPAAQPANSTEISLA